MPAGGARSPLSSYQHEGHTFSGLRAARTLHSQSQRVRWVLTETMQALVRDRYGSPDVLDVRVVPRPVPMRHELLVRVRAASINDWDWGLLHGPSLPFSRARPKPILGSDIAGHVVAVGAEVRHFRVGDEVYGDLSRFGRGGWGGFAEYACAPQPAVLHKPAGITFEQASALPQAGQLAVQGLFINGPLQPRQSILINGAGGGVGTMAIQLARLHGAHVTGVDCAAKLDMMRALGFDQVIDYRREDFTANGRRYDLILDTKTTRSPRAYLRALAPAGTYVTVGGDMTRLLQVAVTGLAARLTLRKSLRVVTLAQNKDLAYLGARCQARELVPVIDGPYPLREARDAFRRFGAALHHGKVVITVG
jgi:NADPH:quinone reductase-like Zn-dependent oxidoreductase